MTSPSRRYRARQESTIMFRNVARRGLLRHQKELLLPKEYEVTVSAAEQRDCANALPVEVVDDVNVGLDTRLDRRHLDVRRSHVNAMFILRSKVLQYGREHLIEEGFNEMNSPKIIACEERDQSISNDVLIPQLSCLNRHSCTNNWPFWEG